MGALSITLSISPLIRHNQSPPKTHFSTTIFSSKFTSINLNSTYFPHNSLVLRSIQKDSNDPLFLDEDGVVDDMDGYLNYLSLEYDSVWDTKPSWCQPWTISLTGVMVIACSWVFLHSVVITTVVLTLICTWWYIFLYAYPKAYLDMITERRNKVTSGVEDTFGQ
ncbi:spindle pole body-associated protein [Tasmannia lanceolata]|uniref:spindle pole body-associated protein n=1 Tax=Tasmannia lanceolata TaxID=3420 RepID=UPI0040644E11